MIPSSSNGPRNEEGAFSHKERRPRLATSVRSSTKKTACDYCAWKKEVERAVLWSAKNDTKFERTDPNNRWRLTQKFSCLNDVTIYSANERTIFNKSRVV